LASHYGTTSGATWAQGDFSYDGRVDVTDLGDLVSNYGQSFGGGSAASVNSTVSATSAATVANGDNATERTNSAGESSGIEPLKKRRGSAWSEIVLSAQ